MRKGRKGHGLVVAAATCALLGVALVGSVLWMRAESSPAPDPTLSEAEQEAAREADGGFPKVDWEHWKRVNPDVVAWVTIPGTKVDYPIVQAHVDDPDFYLHHDPRGRPSVYGTPYLDAGCAEGGVLGSANAVVYAHHMDDGTMFAAVSRYSTDASFAKSHERVLVQTPEERTVLHVRFARIADAAKARKRVTFADAADHGSWYASELARARVVLDGKARPDAVVTLVTCSYNVFKNERTLVYASAGE